MLSNRSIFKIGLRPLNLSPNDFIVWTISRRIFVVIQRERALSVPLLGGYVELTVAFCIDFGRGEADVTYGTYSRTARPCRKGSLFFFIFLLIFDFL